jgi:hypothetical protein
VIEEIRDSGDPKALERLLVNGVDPEVGSEEVVGRHGLSIANWPVLAV